MKQAVVEFDILDYWHAGTGAGEGAHLDAVVINSPAGLPVIPGRTVKGLLREAMRTAEDCGALADGTTDRLFGAPSTSDSHREPGELSFTDAGLPIEVEAWAEGQSIALLEHLYPVVASTRIDERGQALDKALRRFQVTVPVTLMALVEGPRDGDWIPAMKAAVPLIRSLGSHRHRGLGRVQVRVKEVGS